MAGGVNNDTTLQLTFNALAEASKSFSSGVILAVVGLVKRRVSIADDGDATPLFFGVGVVFKPRKGLG